MKSINEPITVDARNGVPLRFQWGRRTYPIRKLLDYWILQTRWWGCEERRIYFRLETDAGVVDVYRTSHAPSEELEEAGSSVSSGRTKESTRRERPPLPLEGDTHTREHRRTDAIYRPDVKRREARTQVRIRTKPSRWMLSKMVD
jgi:hypothetical protein